METEVKPIDRIPIELHPMSDETSVIATDALEQGCNRIIRMLRGRQTGEAVYAVPRTGKTHFIDYFIQHHPTFLGAKIPCFKFKMWTTQGAPAATRASFYADLLRLLGYPDYTKGNAVEKFAIVIDLIVARARQCNESRIVMFVDEAQNLRVAEYGFLMDIFNELRDHGIRMKTVLVGQPALFNGRNKLRDYRQIKARFMPRWYPMRGVHTSAALGRILRAIDEETEFPPDSGWTYTFYFVPQAFSQGFRLSAYLDMLWAALTDAARIAKLTTPHEFTMQTVMDFLTELLKEISYEDNLELRLEKDLAQMLALEAVRGQVDDEDEVIDRASS